MFVNGKKALKVASAFVAMSVLLIASPAFAYVDLGVIGNPGTTFGGSLTLDSGQYQIYDFYRFTVTGTGNELLSFTLDSTSNINLASGFEVNIAEVSPHPGTLVTSPVNLSVGNTLTYSVEPATYALAFAGLIYSPNQGGGGNYGFEATITAGNSVTAAVPEPATWAMMIFGFLSVGVMAHRRRSLSSAIAAA